MITAPSSRVSTAPSSRVSTAPSSRVSAAPSSRVSAAPHSRESTAPYSEVCPDQQQGRKGTSSGHRCFWSVLVLIFATPRTQPTTNVSGVWFVAHTFHHDSAASTLLVRHHVSPAPSRCRRRAGVRAAPHDHVGIPRRARRVLALLHVRVAAAALQLGELHRALGHRRLPEPNVRVKDGIHGRGFFT